MVTEVISHSATRTLSKRNVGRYGVVTNTSITGYGSQTRDLRDRLWYRSAVPIKKLNALQGFAPTLSYTDTQAALKKRNMVRVTWKQSKASGADWWSESNEVTGEFWPPSLPSSDTRHTAAISRCRSLAAQGVINRTKTSSWNIAVTFAEFSETCKMILGTARKLHSVWKALKKRRFKEVNRKLGLRKTPQGVTGKLSSDWLAYRYGWAPLVGDVYSATETLADIIYSTRHMFRVNYSAYETLPDLDPGFSNIGNASLFFDMSRKERLVRGGRTTVKHGYVFEVTNPNLVVANQLGLTNPLVVAHELVTLSFVADWFFNIGNYLEALTAFQGLTMRDGYEIVVKESVWTMDCIPTGVSGTYISGFTVLQCDQAQSVRREFTRSPLSAPILPTLGLKRHASTTTGLKRVADAAALLYSFLR